MIILILLFCHLVDCDKHTVPVMVLDFGRSFADWDITNNPINVVRTYEFNDLLYRTALTNATVIIFIERELSLEDLTSKDSKGSAYGNLEPYTKQSGVKFMYSVDHAFKVLNLTFPSTPDNTYNLTSSVAKLHKIDSTKAIYVHFTPVVNETRISALRKHSVIMEETCKLLGRLSKRPVIGFYTGQMNPNLRHSVLFVATKPVSHSLDAPVSILTEGAAFKLANVFITKRSVRSGISQMPFIASETWTDKGMSVLMSYTDFELMFNFEFYQTSWRLRSIVAMEDNIEVGKTETYINAPWNCSFYCSMPIEIPIKGEKSSITISKYHIMPFIRPLRQGSEGLRLTVSQLFALRSPKHCGPNFSTTIISSLAITAFCLGIAFIGIIMLMNCHTFDRYDDPLGKRIQITDKS